MAEAQTASAQAPGGGELAAKRARLKEIIKERSVRTGEAVTLASGRTSNFYVDMRATTLDAEGALLIAELVVDAIAGENVDFIGGLEVGAVPMVAVAGPVALQQGKRLKPFFVRKKIKEHGRRLRIEGLADDEFLEGARVVMVEDVTTSGGSVLDAAEVVREAGGEVVMILSVVDRGEGAAERFAQAGYRFKALFSAGDFT